MDLDFIGKNFSIDQRRRIENVIAKKIKKEKILLTGNKIILTDAGKLFADAIAVKLFV